MSYEENNNNTTTENDRMARLSLSGKIRGWPLASFAVTKAVPLARLSLSGNNTNLVMRP